MCCQLTISRNSTVPTCRIDQSSIKSFWQTFWSNLSKQELVHCHKGLSEQCYMLIHPSVWLNPGPHIELTYEFLKPSTSADFNAFSNCHGEIEYRISIFSSIPAAEALRFLSSDNSLGGLVMLSGCPQTVSQRGLYMGNSWKASGMLKDRKKNISKITWN